MDEWRLLPSYAWRHCLSCDVYWKTDEGNTCWMCGGAGLIMPGEKTPDFNNVATWYWTTRQDTSGTIEL